ncbi:TetR/AcrR family transcriptional regulator [Mycobacterium sp. SMC-2]|uniref:TetR/AcrR family transcriptional regulator n=1 Tax=Mycobacterium TaxID=1763 RepID=UPI001CE2164C|nr:MULTISPECIES: TetR/AcrR family transcriptional regulator [Mycobacterium]MCA4759006.1 TetR/AcrR family transcriptional regulator [Mycobacterium avium subsp. hominissuis]UXA09582.1 TetR/AcrR family transcriptional regulator [Mycobacterium sp. SMC-2]
MTVTSGSKPAEALDAGRGVRTRTAILQASRQLFLERGYAGTPINAITESCGISRAGFYTYFKDKREVFNVLGETAYHDVLAVLSVLEGFGGTLALEDLRSWVGDYFAYLDRHGAFVMASAHSAPDDEAFRRSRNRMLTRASWKLGQAIGGTGTHSPEVIGVAVMGLLDRSWYAVQTQTVAVDRDEMIAVVAEMIYAMTRL